MNRTGRDRASLLSNTTGRPSNSLITTPPNSVIRLRPRNPRNSFRTAPPKALFYLRRVVLLTLVATATVFSPEPAHSSSPEEARGLHEQYGELLAGYVRDGGVDYADWVANEEDARALDAYVARLTDLTPADWPREDGLAYWINLYNAVTVKLILDHYPVKSIKDIGGFLKKSPWKRHLVTVGERELTLNDIENEIIRPTFNDPRIHFALNCASIGCPALRSQPYRPSSINDDLDAACQDAMNSERWVKVEGSKVWLSKIFDWYEDDFSATGVVEFVNRYREGDPIDAKAKISYLDYDWSLNIVK